MSLFDYLIKQREERVEKINKYYEAKAAYDAAKAALESFGDVADIEAEVHQLDVYIDEVAKKDGAIDDSVAEDGGNEGGANDCVTEVQA